MYRVYFTKQALKDWENLKGAKLSEKAKWLTELVKKDSFQNPPSYESRRSRGALLQAHQHPASFCLCRGQGQEFRESRPHVDAL